MALSAPTARFGRVTYDAMDVIAMPAGMPPFLDAHSFVLISNDEEEPFVWFQSLDDPALALALAPLAAVFPDHDARIRESLAQRSPSDTQERLAIFGVVVLHPDPDRMTINLAAPLVVDLDEMTARQIVLDAPVRMTQHPLIETLNSSKQT